MKSIIVAFSLLLVSLNGFSLDKKLLRNEINKVTKNKDATVGVALIIGKDSLCINNKIQYPTMSTYKFHVALAALDFMNKNDIELDEQIHIAKEDLHPDTHSPLRDNHPEGNFHMPIGDAIKYMVILSDNNACDVLIKMVGGVDPVDQYIRSLGISDFSIGATENKMHESWDNQRLNWTSPYAATKLLEIYRENRILPARYHNFLWRAMVSSETGTKKIKELLPRDIVVAHKSGLSFRNKKGIRLADNDIAIIQLPDGRYYSLAVYIYESKESDATNESIIAKISKVIYDNLLNNR